MRLYISDTNGNSMMGSVHVFDVDRGQRLRTLPAYYYPDIALSRDGSKLCVVHTNLDALWNQDELVIYDTRTFNVIHKANFSHRCIYNVAPTAPGVTMTDDGSMCYVQLMKSLNDGMASYAIGVFDLDTGRFRGPLCELPESPLCFGTFPGRRDLYVVMTGREMVGVGVANPMCDGQLEVRAMAPGGHPGHSYIRRDAPHVTLFDVVAADADDQVKHLYLIESDGTLRVFDMASNRLSEPININLYEGPRVPLQAMLIAGPLMFLGMSHPEHSTRGKSEYVYIYDISCGVFRRRRIAFDLASDKMTYAAAAGVLITMSREERFVHIYSAATAQVLGRFGDIGRTPADILLDPEDGSPSRFLSGTPWISRAPGISLSTPEQFISSRGASLPSRAWAGVRL